MCAGTQPEIFQSRQVLVELGHLDKHFVKEKKAQEKSLHEKFLEFFLLDTLKIIFWMQNLTQRWAPIGSFSKIRTLFYFQKSAGGVLPQYPPISLNILENGKLFWLCQGCEYAWSSYMFHRILKILGVLDVPEFWNGIVSYLRVTQRREYDRIWFSVPQ